MDMLDVLKATAGCEFPVEVAAAGGAFWDGAAFCGLDLLLALLLFFFPWRFGMLYFDVVESWCFLADNVNADAESVRAE